ncbi:hypothetical protein MMC17_003194 [Xylographa soralifera]|nr:hypothetical protein [Xylographa soralifera]
MIGYPDPNFVPGQPDASSNLAFWPFELQQIPALSLIKLSVIFFYRRIFNTGATPLLNWSTMTMVALVSMWTISFFFSFLFICGKTPADYWISSKTEKGYCVATQELHLSFAISDTILDILIILMAIPMIWNLRMSTSRKFAVTGIFSLGLITVAASVTRMAIFVQATALRYDPYLDFEYLITASMYWSMLEVGLAFIAANLIVVYGLLTRTIFSSALRSLRSLLPSRFSRVSSREGDDTFDRRRVWARKTGGKFSTSTEISGRDTEEVPLDSRHIHMQQEFGSRVA